MILSLDAADRKTASQSERRLSKDAEISRASRFRWNSAVMLVIFYNIVGVLDIISTTIAIETGAGYEANPFIRLMMNEAGNWWIVAKLFLQGVITAMVLYFPHSIVLSFFAVATTWNGWVVYNNFVIGGVL